VAEKYCRFRAHAKANDGSRTGKSCERGMGLMTKARSAPVNSGCLWISNFRLLGGFYGAEILVPLADSVIPVGEESIHHACAGFFCFIP
jgi:hypothetical protein